MGTCRRWFGGGGGGPIQSLVDLLEVIFQLAYVYVSITSSPFGNVSIPVDTAQ